jgi:hypothetical protein
VRGRETNHAFPAPTGRPAKAQGIALGIFRKISAKPCRGETQAVKFEAQVLGQKPALLFRPYRACHCFTAQTQGDALGFRIAPRWGWKGRVRLTASSRGAGKARFVTRPLFFGLEVRHTDGTFSKFTPRAMT